MNWRYIALVTIVWFLGGWSGSAWSETMNKELASESIKLEEWADRFKDLIKHGKKIDKAFWKKVRAVPEIAKEKGKIAVYRTDTGTMVFTYRNIQGLAVADRDIILGPYELVNAQQAALQGEGPVGATFALVTPFLGNRWPNGIIYYDYANDFEAIDEVEAAIADYEEKTPLDFRRRTDQKNFIMFVNQMHFPIFFSSMSPIGMIGGRQDVKIQTRQKEDTSQRRSSEVLKRSALHEIGHSLGFKHEHSRADREEWIVLDEECIDFWYGISGNYAVAEGHILMTPYDYSSIMHYQSRKAKKGPLWDQQDCFDIVKHPDKRAPGDSAGEIFASFSLSQEDINALHHMYGRDGITSEDNDRFGETLLSYNFDGDDYDDLAVGVPKERISNGSQSGVVLLYKGTASGFVLWKLLVPELPVHGQGFGKALAAGDFNNDTFQDLAVGAPYTTVDGKASAGAVYLFTIKGNRNSEPYMRVEKPVVVGDNPIEVMDRFGHSLAAGRFNMIASNEERNMAHLAIGAPGARYGSAGRSGRVWIYDEGKLPWMTTVDPAAMALLAFGQLGFSMATIPEHQGGVLHTVDKLAIAAPGFTWLDCRPISVYIARTDGSRVNLIQSLQRPESSPLDNFCPHDSNLQPVIDYYPEVWSTNFGTAMTSGDFNNDGAKDLAIGSYIGPQDAQDGKGGRVYIFEQKVATGLFDLQHMVTQEGLDVDNPLDSFGWSLAAADIRNNGFADLAVGAPTDRYDNSDVSLGRAFLFNGCSRQVTGPLALLIDWFNRVILRGIRLRREPLCQGSLQRWKTYGQVPPEEGVGRYGFGSSVALGDFNGDGLQDVAIGAPGKSPQDKPVAGTVAIMLGTGELDSPFTQDKVLQQEFTTPFPRP